MRRKSVSAKERARLFLLHGQTCHFCNCKIHQGESWELSHVIEWELTRDDSDENRHPAHFKCHRQYTYDIGNPMLAKTLRLAKKHVGIRKTQSRPMQGTLQSGVKKLFTGEIIKRQHFELNSER